MRGQVFAELPMSLLAATTDPLHVALCDRQVPTTPEPPRCGDRPAAASESRPVGGGTVASGGTGRPSRDKAEPNGSRAAQVCLRGACRPQSASGRDVATRRPAGTGRAMLGKAHSYVVR
ncbi:hypothetical protein GCM10023100_05970 [Actinocorallia cavernae]|uniref:Secreted protein n=2 Tax=Actinomycetes TaxID=1760 RepID=A0ABP8SB45_9ACTN